MKVATLSSYSGINFKMVVVVVVEVVIIKTKLEIVV